MKKVPYILAIFAFLFSGYNALSNSDRECNIYPCGGNDYTKVVIGGDILIEWNAEKFTNPDLIIAVWNRRTQVTDTIARKVPNTGNYVLHIPETYTPDKYYKFIIADATPKKGPSIFFVSLNCVTFWDAKSSVIEKHKAECYAYPNPASDKLYIKNYKVAYGKIEIYDNAGQCYLSVFPKAEIDISDLPSGVYYVRVNGRMDKIVKE